MKFGAALAIKNHLVWSLLSLVACNADKGNDVTAPFGSLPFHTVCLGRNFVDLPAELRLGGDVELFYGLDKNFKTVKVELVQSDGDVAAFETAVVAQLALLTNRFDADTPSKNMLARQQRIDRDTVLLLSHREPTMSGYYRVLVVAKIGQAVALFRSDVFKQNTPAEIESTVLTVARQTRYARDPQREAKGTCIGPLVIDAGQDGERFNVGARGTTHADLSLSFSINSLLAESDGGLLSRVDSKGSVLAKLGALGSPIRRGNVDIAGRRAEELLEEDKEEGKTVRLFVAETILTTPSTLSNPRIHVEMSMGGRVKNSENKTAYVDPSLGKAESIAVWDALIRSIRLRQGSV